jgi:hypothetical protein
MKCPKCGGENPDGAKFCNSCANPLTQTQIARVKVIVKISVIAMVSFIVAIASIIVLILAVALKRDILMAITIHLFLLAFFIGIIGLIRIALSAGRITSVGFAVIGVFVPIGVFICVVMWPALRRTRSLAFRMTCGTNLSNIGKAMLIYANDYDDELPRAGGPGTRWTGRTPTWDAPDRFTAFGLSKDGTGGTATISSSLYLLVKYSEVSPERFRCKGDKHFKEFKPGWFRMRGKKLADFWDFGPDPAKRCSFSYHNPYGKYYLTTSNEPGMAVSAGRNPWIDAPGHKAKNFALFVPDKLPYKGTTEQTRHGNTWSHQGDGQNVLFLDSHVNFEKRPYCSVDDDNIYTYWNGEDKVRGTPPVVGSESVDKLDSLLVNDPPITRRR